MPKSKKRPAAKSAKRATRARPPRRETVLARREDLRPEAPEEIVEAEPVEPVAEPLSPAEAGTVMPVEVEPSRVEETLARLREDLLHWAKKGRYTKVRFKFRGKQLLPDLPLAAVLAAEGLTFYWGGLLRALLVNFAGNALLKVELVNDSEKKVALGKEQLLLGELDRALALFREAVDMQRDNPAAFLNLGIALKLKGDRPAARDALERTRALDPHGPFGSEAERILATMPADPAAGV
jgi:tetratricopeptide (TPR) repeat protein